MLAAAIQKMGMNLRTLFAIPIAVILIVMLSLAGMVAGQGWSGMIRGKAAIQAVERMRLLLELQSKLRAERVVTNFVFGRPYPVAEFARRRFDDARRDTDQAGRALVVDLRAEEAGGVIELRPDPNLDLVVVKLGAVRSMIDQLLAREPGGRTLEELSTVMPRMLAVSELVDDPVERAKLAVTATDEGLSGLLTDDRLAESLRDQVGLIAAVLLPRFDKGQQASAAELDRVRILLARADLPDTITERYDRDRRRDRPDQAVACRPRDDRRYRHPWAT